MAEVIKVIELADGTLTNMVDKNTKLSVNYKPVTTWYDGSTMDASKVDGDLYTKKGSKYYRKVIDKDGELFLEKDTMAQMRALTPREILYLKAGVYKGVGLSGYYQKGDTPGRIEYFLSDTTEEDDDFSVIEVNTIKLVHDFTDTLNLSYLGLKGDGIQDESIPLTKAFNYKDDIKITSNINKTFFIKGIITVNKIINIDLKQSTIKASPLTNCGIVLHKESYIKNTVFDNVYISVRGQASTVISYNKFINQTFSNISVQNAYNVEIHNNYFTGESSGIEQVDTYPTCQIVTGSKNVTYRNNICENVSSGVTADGINLYIDNIKIHNNKFHGLKWYAAKFDVGNNFSFKDNEVYNSSAYGVAFAAFDEAGSQITKESGNNTIIDGNDFKNISSGAIYILSADNPYVKLIISNNKFNNCKYALDRCLGHVELLNNYFGNGESFINIRGIIKAGQLKVKGNTIETTIRPSEVLKDWGGNDIIGSIILSCQDQDSLNRWISNIEIIDNTFKNFDTNAIMVERSASQSSNLTIRGNTFIPSINSINLIHLGKSRNLIIRDNTVINPLSINVKNVVYGELVGNATGFTIFENNSWQKIVDMPTEGTFIIGEYYEFKVPVLHSSGRLLGYKRLTKGTGNSLLNDWIPVYGFKQSAKVYDVSTTPPSPLSPQTVTTIEEAQTAINDLVTMVNAMQANEVELKAKLNAKLSADRTSGQQSTT